MSLSREDFVRILYQGVLGREADADGLAHHLSKLSDEALHRQAAALLRAFIASDEFRADGSLNGALRAVSPPTTGPVLRHAASLGAHCYSSWTFKQMGLKRYSLPFDWLFSSLAMVTHCIEDGFATFLDQAEYRPVALPDRSSSITGLCQHAFYHQQYGVTDVFNHFDPTEARWYEYMQRAVARFRRLMASAELSLGLAVVKVRNPHDLVGPFQALAETIGRHAPNMQLEVIAVPPPAPGETDFVSRVLQREGVHMLRVLRPFSAMKGLSFYDPFDDLFMRRLVAAHDWALADGI